MLQLRTVRDSFILPLVQIFYTLIICGITLCGFIIVSWGLHVYPEAIPDWGLLVSFAVEGLQETLPPAILLSSVLVILRYRRKPGIVWVSLPLLFITALGLFLSAGIGIPVLMKNQPIYRHPLTADDGYIHRAGNSSIYIEEQSGARLEKVLILDSTRTPALTYYPESSINEQETGSGGVFTGTPGAVMFEPPRFIRNITNDIRLFNSSLRDAADSSFLLFGITSLAILFCIFSGCLLLSIPRWPLYNGILIVFAFRLFLFLAPFLWKRNFQQIAGLILNDSILVYAPALLLAITGLVCILCTGLFYLGRRKVPEKKNA